MSAAVSECPVTDVATTYVFGIELIGSLLRMLRSDRRRLLGCGSHCRAVCVVALGILRSRKKFKTSRSKSFSKADH